MNRIRKELVKETFLTTQNPQSIETKPKYFQTELKTTRERVKFLIIALSSLINPDSGETLTNLTLINLFLLTISPHSSSTLLASPLAQRKRMHYFQ